MVSNVSTDPVPDDVLDTAPDPANRPYQPQSEGVALVVRGHEDPIVIRESEFVLGRYDPGNPQPQVDLMPYGGSSLGVSRHHARILRRANGFVIEDLNSTNGTWVNRQRLPSGSRQDLSNGDVLQLGQLVMRFYYNPVDAVQSVEEHISFRSPTNQFTPDYLATRLSPYLTALAGVQEICNEIRQRESSAIEIGSIMVDGPAIISVQITGARDALKLAKGRMKNWRTENVEKINQFLRMKQVLRKQTAVLMNNIGPPSSTDEVAARELGRELRDAEMLLANEFLREIAPYQARDSLEPYAEMLVKHIHIIAFSPLNVTTNSSSLVN